MKSSLIALFTLFAFIASSAKAEFVVDVNGDPVINGGTYYILPYIWALGGGVGLAKTGNETCPLTVVQSRAEVDNGLPWRISSPLRILYLPTNARLDFFSVQGKVPNCVPSPSSWTIVEKEDGVKSVKISEYKNTIKGVFMIQKYTQIAYKIVFCPTDGNSCVDIGRSSRGLCLVITNDIPLGVVFVKAESSEVSKQVINNVLEA
ncbi:hypothetical protein QN277_022967 [Acacia crassicarpa]|uniref:Uncharacterized protein n=1 Tax=Acacia crassicarpa TaxID=499986 RepID=A0AAE1JK63_9FABA|nr:hypothetical protein QN277_022967 [Acacia crassicarpa]